MLITAWLSLFFIILTPELDLIYKTQKDLYSEEEMQIISKALIFCPWVLPNVVFDSLMARLGVIKVLAYAWLCYEMTEPLPKRGVETPPRNIEEIYRRHFDMVYRISFSYLKNPSDAEDATAVVFVKLLKKDVSFQNAEHEKAWLIRTAINTYKDYLKHWWRKRADIDDYKSLQVNNPFHVDETLKAVMDLPARYKDVIYLYYYKGYTSEEIAGILRKPHSTIRGHLREAKILLKGVLEDEK